MLSHDMRGRCAILLPVSFATTKYQGECLIFYRNVRHSLCKYYSFSFLMLFPPLSLFLCLSCFTTVITIVILFFSTYKALQKIIEATTRLVKLWTHVNYFTSVSQAAARVPHARSRAKTIGLKTRLTRKTNF